MLHAAGGTAMEWQLVDRVASSRTVVVGFQASLHAADARQESPSSKIAQSLPRSLLTSSIRSLSPDSNASSPCSANKDHSAWGAARQRDADAALSPDRQATKSPYDDEAYDSDDDSLSSSVGSSVGSSWGDISRPIAIMRKPSGGRCGVVEMLRAVNARLQEDIERRHMAVLYAHKQSNAKQRCGRGAGFGQA